MSESRRSSRRERNDDQQQSLNEATMSVFEEHGCSNYIQAKFIKEVSKIAIDPSNPYLIPIQPKVKQMLTQEWIRSLCFVVAYLRRYKMDQTLQAMKAEFNLLPKNTGFAKASDLETFFNSLKKVAVVMSDMTFDERVIECRDMYDNADDDLTLPPVEPIMPTKKRSHKH